jgi:hypothetical protein
LQADTPVNAPNGGRGSRWIGRHNQRELQFPTNRTVLSNVLMPLRLEYYVEGCTYNSTDFNIDLAQFPTTVSVEHGIAGSLAWQNPTDGCDILWLQYDVRRFCERYDCKLSPMTTSRGLWHNVTSTRHGVLTDHGYRGSSALLEPTYNIMVTV